MNSVVNVDVPVSVGAVSVLFARVSFLVINERVLVVLGQLIVLSAVGSITLSVVSCASAVTPSNIIAFEASIVTVST